MYINRWFGVYTVALYGNGISEPAISNLIEDFTFAKVRQPKGRTVGSIALTAVKAGPKKSTTAGTFGALWSSSGKRANISAGGCSKMRMLPLRQSRSSGKIGKV